MALLLISLLLAHVLGDFMLQPKAWIRDKQLHKFRSLSLYKHISVHAALLVLAFRFDPTYLFSAILILLSHALIDIGKSYFEGKASPLFLFLFDQTAHVLAILLALSIHFPLSEWAFPPMEPGRVVGFLLALLIVSQVSAVLMSKVMNSWQLEEDDKRDSLDRAGWYIGILERCFVFVFILLDQWSAIGLLIAAKSVFRFGDLTKAKDRKLTEYMLIGTLLSFGLAMLTGLAFQYFDNTLFPPSRPA